MNKDDFAIWLLGQDMYRDSTDLIEDLKKERGVGLWPAVLDFSLDMIIKGQIGSVVERVLLERQVAWPKVEEVTVELSKKEHLSLVVEKATKHAVSFVKLARREGVDLSGWIPRFSEKVFGTGRMSDAVSEILAIDLVRGHPVVQKAATEELRVHWTDNPYAKELGQIGFIGMVRLGGAIHNALLVFPKHVFEIWDLLPMGSKHQITGLGLGTLLDVLSSQDVPERLWPELILSDPFGDWAMEHAPVLDKRVLAQIAAQGTMRVRSWVFGCVARLGAGQTR